MRKAKPWPKPNCSPDAGSPLIPHSNSRKTLAIVIPAYKEEYLDETLGSIAAQTCKDFTVYIGDDASPHDLRSICARWSEKIDLRYHRFDNNLGENDLVAQWQRCIDLSTEPWIWLFSDDDLMNEGCVEHFYREILKNPAYDIYHFDVSVINERGELLRTGNNFPEVLTGYDYLLKRFGNEIESFASNYIFSRDSLSLAGGFESFRRAWCSDDATWIKLAQKTGIKTIGGDCRVEWRYSGKNISSCHQADKNEKLEAGLQFLEWAAGYFTKLMDKENRKLNATFVLTGRRWFYHQSKILGVAYSLFGYIKTALRLHSIFGTSITNELGHMVRKKSR
jgi:glycosyltransferase involved in cell wall biosynthesis